MILILDVVLFARDRSKDVKRCESASGRACLTGAHCHNGHVPVYNGHILSRC